MPYFMDRHDLPGATADDVARAHMMDLEVQERYGVRYLSYWFDFERHSAFCLVDAPNEDQAMAVHAASHGLVANQIIPVDRRTVEKFLGRVVDPTETGVVSSAFRVIMFTDIEGSTALTQQLGDEAAMPVVRQHNAIVRAALDAHGGNEVKHTGDGIMASFDSVTNALSCAIAIQRTLADYNAGQEANRQRFEIRIGLAAGEPVAESGDLFGATVQLAARLAGAANAGEVCVGDAVRELALGKRFAFAPPTVLNLKGFDGPVRAAILNWQDDMALV